MPLDLYKVYKNFYQRSNRNLDNEDLLEMTSLIRNLARNLYRSKIKKTISKKDIKVALNSAKKLYDLVLCKAILIHIDPKKIQRVFQSIYNVTKRGSHVLFAEYYSKDLKKIVYRNNINKLFKDDFASKFLEKYSNFMLIDYGFCYHKDKYPQDDLTWFLMKRK